MAQQLPAGIAYPRWAPDFYLGYGYPIFLFTPLLPYYLVVAVHALGLAFQPAMNVVEAAALVAAGLFAYAWLRRYVGPAGAMVGAVLYALAPYHLVNLYYRGDLSEFVAATWFPAILWSLDRLVRSPSRRRLLLLTLPVAALLLTHFISALLFLPVAGLLAVATIDWRRPRIAVPTFLVGVLAAALAAGLSALSWLPAVAMTGDATFAKLLRFYNYGQNFAQAGQLFSDAVLQPYTAIFAGSQGFGYQFGLLQSVALLAGIVAWLSRLRGQDNASWPRYAALLLIAAVSLAGCLAISAPLWNTLPPLQLVQFPWRLLAIAALPASFFGAVAIDALAARLRPALAGAAVAAVAVSCLVHVQPPRIAIPADFATVAGIARFELLYHLAGTSAAAEYLPPWASQRQVTSAHAFSLVTGATPPADPAASVATWTPSSRQETFAVTRAQPGPITLPVLFFPGWQATVDRRTATIRPAPGSGLATVDLATGPHTVTLDFHDPLAARLGDAVSLVALLVAVGMGASGMRGGALRSGVAKWTGPLSAFGISPPTLGESQHQAIGSPSRPVPHGEVPRKQPHSRTRSSPPILGERSGEGAYWSGERARSPRWTPLFASRGSAILRASTIPVPVAAALLLAAVGGRGSGTNWQPLDADLAGGIHIAGYALAGGGQGSAASLRLPADQPLQLLLQATSRQGRRLDVRLTDAATTDWADWQVTVAAGTTAASLALPAALPPGLYSLRLGSVLPGGTPDFALQHERLVRLLPVDGTLQIGPLVVTAPASPTPPLLSPIAVWPGQARLGDVRLPPTVKAGAAFTPAWTWQAPANPGPARLTETVHLVDGAGHVLAAADSEPAGGLFPTSFWQANQAVLDHPRLQLPADVPPGTYAVRVGLRNGATLIPAEDPAGRVLGDEATAGQVTVLPPAQPAPWDGKGVSIGTLQVELAQPLPPAVPGRDLTAYLRWHRGNTAADISVVTVALTRNGQTLGSTAITIGGVESPAVGWREGETVLQLVDLPVSGSATSGPASLVLSVQSDTAPSVANTTLGTVDVAGRAHVYTAQPATPTALSFANGIQLVGYDLRADGNLWHNGIVTARTALDVTLYFKAAGPTAQPLKVTVQLLSSAGLLLAQSDSEPGGGRAPTTGWVPGEIVKSEHHLALAGLPPGADHLIVALYDPQTNRRIATGGGDTATLTAVTLP